MSDRMRLLFTASPAYGHLLPLLPMLRAAMTAGHDVRLATGPDMVGPMRARSVPAYGVGATWGEIVAERDEEAGAPTPRTSTPNAWSRPACCSAARRPGGCRACWTWPAAGDRTSSCTSRSSSAASCSPGTSDCPASRTGTARCSASTARWVRSSPARPATRACGTRCWPGPRSTSVHPRCAQPGAALWPEALDLRPSAGEAGGREVFDPGPARALRRPLVYVTLGTISNAIPGLMAEMVEALRSLSVDLVVTTGPGVDPASLGPQPAHVTVRQFVPQDQVLRHADLMVSHAGAGTMLGALCHGVPQLCLPHGADQPWNAEAVARARAGIVVPEEECTPEAVRAGVVTLLSSPSYRAAAREVQAEIAAMPTAREVLPRMLELADRDRGVDELAG